MGPLVTIEPEGLFYTKVKAEDVDDIIKHTIKDGEILERLLYKDPATGKHCSTTSHIPFYKRQKRFILKMCGLIDPEDINEYIANGGYEGAKKAWTEMSPSTICEEILYSGLRGRGGGGFPTGKKWDMARVEKESKKIMSYAMGMKEIREPSWIEVLWKETLTVS